MAKQNESKIDFEIRKIKQASECMERVRNIKFEHQDMVRLLNERTLEQIVNEGNAIIQSKDNYNKRLSEQIENMQNTIDTCRQLNSELVKENVNLWTCIGVLAVVFVIALIAFI